MAVLEAIVGRVEAHNSDGRVCLNNRYHDPQLGAFISVDPLVVQTGEPYIYGAANPIIYSDPLGLFSCYDPDNSKNCVGDLESTVTQSGTGNGRIYSNGAGSHYLEPAGSTVPIVKTSPDYSRFIADAIAAAANIQETGGGACASVEANFIVGGSGSVCTVSLDDIDAQGWMLSLGLSVKSNVSASATLDAFTTNAASIKRLEGTGGCFATSAGEGGTVSTGICGGMDDDGSFNGVVLVFGGAGIGVGLVPVDGSVSVTKTWASVSERRNLPVYRNPNGTCTSGSNAGRCGQGSQNAAGIPAGFP